MAGLLGFVCLVFAAVASAGSYHVYSCRTPTGESAPADGWSGASTGAYDDYALNTCAQGGALTAALGELTAHMANLDQATWTFSTPTADTMLGATLWRAADAGGGAGFNASYEASLAGPTEMGIFDDCEYQSKCPSGVGDPAQPLAEVNRVLVPSANLGAHLYVSAECEGAHEFECPSGHGDANGYAAAENLYAADITLEQSAGLTATNVSGELASAPTVEGTSDLIFSASDPGAGVWEATFSVDGKLVQSTVPNENGGRCRDVGQSSDGLPAFLYLQPCPASESVDVPFITTGLSNGVHHLVVSVLDAAGNSAPVLDRKVDVENPLAQPGVAAAKPLARRAPSRRVGAQLRLKVTPHRLGANRSVRFSGRLLGGSIPKGGKLLVLEGRRSKRGAWLKFDVLRTNARGRFHARYRFTFLGPGRWQLRVLCEAEAGYPFAPGTSNAVRVRVV